MCACSFSNWLTTLFCSYTMLNYRNYMICKGILQPNARLGQLERTLSQLNLKYLHVNLFGTHSQSIMMEVIVISNMIWFMGHVKPFFIHL